MSGGSTLPRVAALCALGASLAVLALVSMPGGHRAGRVALVGDDDLFDLIPPVTYTPRGVISHSALPPEASSRPAPCQPLCPSAPPTGEKLCSQELSAAKNVWGLGFNKVQV